jgi:uncharacterized protein (DUF58 family)
MATGVGLIAATARGKRSYRVHAPFVLYCLVCLLVAIGAFNSNNNLLFWLFGLGLGMILVSGFISGQMLMAIRVERDDAEATVPGELVRTRYRVTNTNRFFPAFALTIRELPPAPMPTETGRLPAPGVAEPIEAFVSHVGAGKTVLVEGRGEFGRRGAWPLVGFEVTSDFPFGIVRKAVRFALPGRLLVLPDVLEPDPALVERALAGSAREAGGGRVPVGAPSGDEFIALRAYVPGDSPRTVAWRASARLAVSDVGGGPDLLVRQSALPPAPRVWVGLDLAGAADAGAYEGAISLAAGVTRALQRAGQPSRSGRGDVRVGVVIPSVEARISPGNGARWFAGLMDTLARLPEWHLARQSLEAKAGQGETAPHFARPHPPGLKGERWVVVHAADENPAIGPADAQRVITAAGRIDREGGWEATH